MARTAGIAEVLVRALLLLVASLFFSPDLRLRSWATSARRHPQPALVLAAPGQPAVAVAERQPSKCEALLQETLSQLRPTMSRWEQAASDGHIIHGFGAKASRFLNRSLSTFDKEASKSLGGGQDNAQLCANERKVLDSQLQQQLHAIFLVQRSTVEQTLYSRLRKELLRRMRRRRRPLDVREKLRLLQSAMEDYDSQARELQPFFVLDSERARAQKRLSELQWGIEEAPEAKEMKQRWKMERMRRMPMRQSKGISVSLSPGMRLMLRPSGLGNLQIYSRRQVGPPHNPNEVSIGVHNDGKISDVYNKKAQPPLVKFQPTIGIDLSLG